MARLSKRRSLRVPDHFAVVAALVLTLTAAASIVEWPDDRLPAGGIETALPLKADKDDNAPIENDAPNGLTARFLLFRQG